jgi:hypothetical protein
MAKVKSAAQLYLTPTGVDPTDSALALALTGISAAAPASAVAVAALDPAFIEGTIAMIEGTGAADLDGYAWRALAPSGSSFKLDDTDRTGDQATTGGTYQPFIVGEDLIHACVAQITVTGQAPDSISMDDMCGTSTVLGDSKPPTFTFTGWVDKDSAGFRNLMQASLESPKQPRFLLIDYGEPAGYIFGPVEIGEITITAATSAGLQFSGSGVFTEVPTYSWALGPVTA